MSSEAPRYKTVSISPEHHAKLEKLAGTGRLGFGLGAMLEWLIDREVERREQPQQGVVPVLHRDAE